MQIPDIPNLIHYAIPFFALTVIIEVILTIKVKLEDYDFKDASTSLLMGFGNVLLGIITKAIVLTAFLFLYKYRFFTISVTLWTWVILLFAEDFMYYWFHRISHESRLFWASHVVHHSSKKYNLSTALRQTWSGGFYTFIFWIPLILVGFHPIMVMAQMSISLIYQYWIHTELIKKMPKWFEAIFNTPSHHRVHHATNPQYLDRNHAGIFIIWDKLFGTFEPEIEKPVYGLVSNINTYNPLKIAFIEWYNMLTDFFNSKTSIFNKFKYLIKPPGWKHDGTSILSTDLRKEWEEKNK
ncbi:Sterol desaturase/sphingolipid hydroxylase, fatty acid hydroxylase superfamily [Polaribacter sp. KT25b]|uniref:sterol desaturase family protein n=1 Tax=Polaribacter sp. KT25b TaxID=1855336 RepID=UPI0008793217|nr:sterol desaturase family protein [Polaribacter sp. KT25b]SDS05224.1 Sterol desaturase/sphingolipid hydroxylase, fatty acid hydroxylase superfamily [Polaribacter sp. KT25b]